MPASVYYEPDVPDEYVPFRRLEICGNVFENVRFLIEVGNNHPFLIGRGNPYPKVWISTKNDKNDWQRAVLGDRGVPNIGLDGRYVNIQDNPGDRPQHGNVLFCNDKRVLLVRAISEDAAIIDYIDLRPFCQPIWHENGTLHIDSETFTNAYFSDLRTFIKFVPVPESNREIVELKTPIEKSSRPSIPRRVALSLRQGAGFGCCLCGHAIIDYHHIVPWAEKQHFDLLHMMAVCPNCHRKMDVMSREDQYEIKSKPFNISRGFVQGQLVAPRKLAPVVQLGEIITFHNCRAPIITIDDTPILTVQFDEVGRAHISLNLFDEHDNLIAVIQDNDWVSGVYKNWDFQCREGYMKIMNDPKSILLEFSLRGDVLTFTGRFWKSGNSVEVTPSAVLMKRGENTILKVAHVTFDGSRGFTIRRQGSGWTFGMG